MRLLIVWFCGLVGIFAQFQTTCNTGCVNNATWWQANTTAWPAGCALQLNYTVCGVSLSTILANYSGDTLPAPNVLVEWLVAKANVCAGACTVTTSNSAMTNLGNDITSANAGTVPTTYTAAGCSLGLATYESQLNTGTFGKALGQTLYKYNTGMVYGPCPCHTPQCRF